MEISEDKQVRMADYVRGRLDPSLENELSGSVNADDAVRREVLEAARIELIASTAQAQDSLNTASALARVHSKIDSRRRSKRLESFRRVAAACCLPAFILLGFYVWNTHFRNDSKPVTMNTSTGVTSELVLPDGTKVWLNSNSTLTYPDKFGRGDRSVVLEGEAYFEVSEDRRHKFVVNASDVQVEVYGTRFNVEAYPDSDGKIRTSLYQGSIGLKFVDPAGDTRCVLVKPGQKYVYDTTAKKMSLGNSDVSVETSWKDGRILFDSTPLAEVFRMIGNRYNVEFIVKDSSLLRNRYTGCFTNQRLEVVLAHFQKSAGMRFDLDYVGSDAVSSTLNGRQVIVVR